jgi:hypothetical protein
MLEVPIGTVKNRVASIGNLAQKGVVEILSPRMLTNRRLRTKIVGRLISFLV